MVYRNECFGVLGSASGELIMRTVLLALSVALNLWLAVTVVRLENYHYATQTGMCERGAAHDHLAFASYQKCLDQVETRTSPLWHLYYALADQIGYGWR
jgi:hypothetical protein